MRKSNNKKSTNTNKQALENLNYEIASELGVSMGANATSRDNGSVGGEMTKRLVQMGEQKYNKSSK